VRWLEEQGTGYPVGSAVVPIVGAAIVLDIGVAVPHARPDAAAGRAAAEAATTADPPEGGHGAGAGCTVAKVAGLEHAWRGGQGIAVRRAGDLVVGVLVVNNGVGEVFDADGTALVASRAPAGAPRWPRDHDGPLGASGNGTDDDGPATEGPASNTIIGVVATNARLTKQQAHRVADLAHDGVARAVVPAHTSLDGDALFCLATGRVEASVDRVALLAVEAVEEATRRGPLRSVSTGPLDGFPGGAVPGRADTPDPS